MRNILFGAFLVALLSIGIVLVKLSPAKAPVVPPAAQIKQPPAVPAPTLPVVPSPAPEKLSEKEQLLQDLKSAADKKDFDTFAELLKKVYEHRWDTDKDFAKVESDLYVYATNTYWLKGDLEDSLRVSTAVYNQVSQGWRFRYLRIVTLEKYGRNALNAGDLAKAESYAMQILQMMYRPEGANLLADVYIQKIQTDISTNNKKQAQADLNYVWDYEVSQDRRDKLTSLKDDIGKL